MDNHEVAGGILRTQACVLVVLVVYWKNKNVSIWKRLTHRCLGHVTINSITHRWMPQGHIVLSQPFVVGVVLKLVPMLLTLSWKKMWLYSVEDNVVTADGLLPHGTRAHVVILAICYVYHLSLIWNTCITITHWLDPKESSFFSQGHRPLLLTWINFNHSMDK